ncbi:winged helix-turn-helix domain-containing tetratricopeptide repeat protein [Rhizobium viscosum]|uniref:TolB-like protein/Flp pilus assembly protein TadD n=1 Tax=Rhizobium viscosum TaxID=1673 RepID=A0ABR9IUD1_RHIVS|nr:winged helix-turn-helix domain-containing protein [Rhizobium viscosum]MBE1506814.1 TolB-like protein/Flp pilus assembly protein TadD [Rhizobium viscosum]
MRRDGEAIGLGRRGIALLDALLSADGQAVSKDDLLARAWPGLIVEEANLTVQIAALRKALGKAPNGLEWIATVPRIGYRLPHILSSEIPLRAMRPTIAVLPFENLSSDGEYQYFADGTVEDIIVALSRFRTFAVVARNSSFAYKDRNTPIRDIANALGVRYILQGSVRRHGDRLRVTVQLVDADADTHLWVDRFDGELSDIFDFQDRITDAVVGLVEPEVRKAEIERARRKHPDSLDAYDLYLRALPYFRGTTTTVRAEAVRLLERAVQLDPGFATGLAYAAWAYERYETFGSGLSETERQRCLQLAETALETGYDDPQVVAICALVFTNVGHDRQRSLAMLRDARNANPNNPTVLSLFAFLNVMAGDIETGRDTFLRALQIAPGALENYEIMVGVGIADLFKGEFEQAVEWALRSLVVNNEWLGAYWTLAAAYAHLGRVEQAQTTIAKLRAKAPLMRVHDLERHRPRYAERYEIMIDGVRKAGLPD